jgi:hypothetical protein
MVARFAEKLRLHARTEEGVLYPAAILVGEYLKLILNLNPTMNLAPNLTVNLNPDLKPDLYINPEVNLNPDEKERLQNSAR